MAADGYIEHKARTDRREYQREEGANERTPPEIVQYTANYNPNLCSSAERLYPFPHCDNAITYSSYSRLTNTAEAVYRVRGTLERAGTPLTRFI